MRRARRAGFTLVEVMLALAILGMALVVLVRSVYGNINGAQGAFYMGVATDLARAKMYDLEELLLDEGYQETEQELDGDFSEEGWAQIKWSAKIEPVELPSYDVLMGLAQDQGREGAPPPEGGDGEEVDPSEAAMDKFQSSALGGMLGMMGGGFDSASEAQTGGFIQAQYTLVQEVLKQSIRKITLTLHYDTGFYKESFDTVLYVVDSTGIQKAMGGLGADT